VFRLGAGVTATPFGQQDFDGLIRATPSVHVPLPSAPYCDFIRNWQQASDIDANYLVKDHQLDFTVHVMAMWFVVCLHFLNVFLFLCFFCLTMVF